MINQYRQLLFGGYSVKNSTMMPYTQTVAGIMDCSGLQTYLLFNDRFDVIEPATAKFKMKY